MEKAVEERLKRDYQKLRQLKISDKGEVWVAMMRQGGDLVIIKRVKLTGLPYAELKKFPFKLTAKIYFFAEDETETVIVEEFIEGETLLEGLQNNFLLTESEAEKILLQLCEGLKELHAQKIIHRDIKPSNLILQVDGRIRLIDFDAARTFKSGKEEDTKIFLTRGYAPPEQYGVGYGQTDQRSDIYSLGVTIKSLLGENYNGYLKKILDKCTEFDPARRFQSVEKLRRKILFDKYFGAAKKFTALVVACLGIYFFATNLPVAEAPIDIKISDLTREEFPLSLGGLKLGDSVDTMQKIFGTEKETRVAQDLPDTFYHEYKDLVVTVRNNFVIGIATYTNAVADVKGIRQGDSLDKVLANYGAEGWTVEELDGATFYEYLFESRHGTLAVERFAIKNNVVEYIGLRLEK